MNDLQMKHWRLITALLLFHSLAHGQKNYLPGYVVVQADTMRGYLKESTEEDARTKAQFRKTANAANDITYGVNDLTAFGFNNGNHYRKVAYTNAINGEKVVHFAKCLVDAPTALYSYMDADVLYFIIRVEKADTTYLLFADKKTAMGDLQLSGNYLNTLNFLSFNCPSVNKRLGNLGFRETEMIKFVKDVNECASPGTAVRSFYRKDKITHSIVVSAGGIALGNNNTEIAGSLLVKFIVPAISRNTSLNAGIRYMDHGIGSTDPFNRPTITHRQLASVPVTIQSHFGKKSIRPYIQGGIAFYYTKETIDPPPYFPGNTYQGFQGNYGVAGVLSVGLDINITRQLYINADLRYDFILILHYPTIGLAYSF